MSIETESVTNSRATPQPHYYPFSWENDVGEITGGTFNPITGVLTVTWGLIQSYNGESLPGKWISDRDVYAKGTLPTIGAQVAYELATPIEYQLTPSTIPLNAGENVFWAGTGNVSMTYKTQPG